MLLNLTKEELCLISIALNEYQMNRDNYHLEEMAEVSTKIDGLYKVCTCRESIVADDYLDSLSEGYDTKVDALVDSMGVTDTKVSNTHRRKDMDLL